MGKLYLNAKEIANSVFDVIVIGGGHAGIEACLATSRMGKSTLMICGNFKRVGNMPCNPSIGGPAKGIIVREIDALGGEMAKAADKTALQFKLLNSSKGPAVRRNVDIDIIGMYTSLIAHILEDSKKGNHHLTVLLNGCAVNGTVISGENGSLNSVRVAVVNANLHRESCVKIVLAA